MIYRLYCLRNRKSRRTSQEKGKVRYYINRIELTIKKRRLSGHDPIRVFDFFARFVKEASIPEISEAQVLISLPSFLESLVPSQFEAAVGVETRKDGVISSLFYIVQYLLQSYANPQNNHLSDSETQRHNKTQGISRKILRTPHPRRRETMQTRA